MSWELDEACMRAMGWEYKSRFPGDKTGYWRASDGETVISEDRPHFSTDPDAARLLEEYIARRNQSVQAEYVFALAELLFGEQDEWGTAHVWKMICATPEQRTHAFLRVVRS